MKLYPLSVGPIVGAVSATSIRLWGRGQKTINWTCKLECYLIVEIYSEANPRNKIYKTAPLQKDFDYTGVLDFDELEPDSEYIYKMGWIESDQSNPAISDSNALSKLAWDHLDTYYTATASPSPNAPRSFAFGSCRYMLRLPKIPLFLGKGLGDKTFERLIKEHQSNPIHRFLMLGDQIYADDFAFLFPDRSKREFNMRYRHAFSSKYLQKAMAQIPTAMMWDDHEIQNNWPERNRGLDLWPITAIGKTKTEKRKDTYKAAKQTYFIYQLRHSPAFDVSGQTCTSHWYQFQDGCCDFFVTDTRAERTLSEDEDQKQIMSTHQMNALKSWLSNGNERVKVVASSTLIFPDSAMGNEDQWSGFRHQQAELLDYIQDQEIRRVIFISGDVHASFSTTLIDLNNPKFKVISIISSPFYWPYYKNDANSFQLSGKFKHSYRCKLNSQSLKNTHSESCQHCQSPENCKLPLPFKGNYFVADSTPVISEANFTRVTVTPTDVHIQIIPRRARKRFGKDTPILTKSYSF